MSGDGAATPGTVRTHATSVTGPEAIVTKG